MPAPFASCESATQRWPLGIVWGHRIPVLYGSLVEAVKREATCDVQEAWGVGPVLVGKWRKALKGHRTVGDHLKLPEGIRASDPARAQKIAAAKRGKPRRRHFNDAMRNANVAVG